MNRDGRKEKRLADTLDGCMSGMLGLRLGGLLDFRGHEIGYVLQWWSDRVVLYVFNK